MLLSKTHIPIVGKGSLMCIVFQPQLSHIRMCLRPETLPHPEIMSPHSQGRAYHLVRGYHRFRHSLCFCLCLKCVQHMVPVQPHRCSCPPRRGDRVPSIVSIASFHPQLHRAVFSLATLIPRCRGQKY